MENLAKTYNPHDVEEKIYKFWEDNQFFKADAKSKKKPFSIVIPPPNVTGILHMGHALDGTLQDILVRYKRMKGFEALWLPGTDHAGIATQNVVEKKLRKEGKTRHDLGREKFLEITWDWANEHRSRILEQFKRLGASFDLSRERFTLDEGCSKAVKQVFVTLYNEGLIYKGAYIVNWCPRCMSAISDIETEYLTEQGHLWEIAYPFRNEFGAVVVATTRPETMFGDVAVAVNPKDPRYLHLIGKNVVIPMIGRDIPIIADEAVEMDFGTGALKITPAHDPNDYEIGKKHGFSPIWVLDENGNMSYNEYVPAELRGLDRYEAREKVLQQLKLQGELVRTIPYEHNVGHCQRCGDTIEPYLSEQWFVKMAPLAKKPIEAISKEELNFIPPRWTKIYLDWMNNVRDWCISRQLWWGHQIPAYYCEECGEMMVSVEKPEKCTKCSSSSIKQDTDVLDTWFSSALWPFSTMGWPDTKSPDLNKFYPTSVLVTGFDIIFFWVARMVVMGYKFTNKSPFEYVYIHGLIRDEKGQKMSKSRGNTIDPLEIIDKYGSDALRFTLTNLVTYGSQDIKLSDERFEFGRNFANKIWNASRFVMMNLEGMEDSPIDMTALTVADKWILHKYAVLTDEINKNLESFRFSEAAQLMYDFFWSIYCDWYLEIAKIQLQNPKLKLNTQKVLRFVLENTLKMLHPIMPHITEEIWLLNNKNTIMFEQYPEYDPLLKNEQAERKINKAIETIKALRNIRQSFNIPVSAGIKVKIFCENAEDREDFELTDIYIKDLAKVERISFESGLPQKMPSRSATAMIGKSLIIVSLEGLIDLEKEVERQNKKIETLEKELKNLSARINSPKFLENAPKEVIVQTKDRIKEIEQQSQAIEDLLKSLVA
ncbi:MAG: valine--tRNA ligase [Candidatus Melainabacteria bacterium GWF2_37_15]|nr:MAG: valine--tRNA ligase [Candidatus Melainabacteria bacterium GWF2_37_15]